MTAQRARRCPRCNMRLALGGTCGNQSCSTNRPTLAPPASRQPETDAPRCDACDTRVGTEDRFCHACGVPLETVVYDPARHGLPGSPGLPSPRGERPASHASSGFRRRPGIPEDDESSGNANSA